MSDVCLSRSVSWFRLVALGLLVLNTVGWAQHAGRSRGEPKPRSTSAAQPQALALSQNGTELYVAYGATAHVEVRVANTGSLLRQFALPAAPSGLALSGDRLYVTTSSESKPQGGVYLYEASSGKLLAQAAAGAGAHGPRLTADGARLVVLNRWEATVTVYETPTLQTLGTIPVLREPGACDVTPDGRWLYVANFLPTTRADAEDVSAELSLIDLNTLTRTKDIPLYYGSNAVSGVAISLDGGFVYVVHNVGAYLLPTNRLIMGWQNFSMLTILSTATQSVVANVILDDVERGAANPSAVCVSPDDRYVYVTHAGTHELSVIDQDAMLAKLIATPEGSDRHGDGVIQDVSRDFRFLVGLRQRMRLNGNGPRQVVAGDDKVFTLEYFTESLSILKRDTSAVGGHAMPVQTISLTPNLTLTEAQMGHQYFCDATTCFQHWQSCISCHPSARADALNWDVGNDGIGNDKNTKSLLHAHALPPTTVTGVRPNAETSVRAGFAFVEFNVVPDSYAAKVDTYLRELKPVPSPYLVDGQLSEAAVRGEILFRNRGCGVCHSGPYFSDQQQHTMGTLGPRDIGTHDGTWDTPTLIECWRTAPYLHDGRSATMKDVFTVERHGFVNGLSDQEIDDLVEYVLSL